MFAFIYKSILIFTSNWISSSFTFFPLAFLYIFLPCHIVNNNLFLLDLTPKLHASQVVLTNGLVNLTLTIPGGMVSGVTYKGSDNLLDTRNKEDNRGYYISLYNMTWLLSKWYIKFWKSQMLNLILDWKKTKKSIESWVFSGIGMSFGTTRAVTISWISKYIFIYISYHSL